MSAEIWRCGWTLCIARIWWTQLRTGRLGPHVSQVIVCVPEVSHVSQKLSKWLWRIRVISMTVTFDLITSRKLRDENISSNKLFYKSIVKIILQVSCCKLFYKSFCTKTIMLYKLKESTLCDLYIFYEIVNMKWEIYIIYILIWCIWYSRHYFVKDYVPAFIEWNCHMMSSELCIHMSQYSNVGEFMIYPIAIDISYYCIIYFIFSIYI